MDKLEKFFVEDIKKHNMTDPLEILNWYRNLYYKEDIGTERSIMAYAINDLFMKYKEQFLRGEDEKKTDITSGRIIQRVLDEKFKDSDSEVAVVHGVDYSHNIERLTNNLYEYFPESKITLEELEYGYELKIKV